MKRAAVALAACLTGCAGTWVSSEPLYPADWPAPEASTAQGDRADLSGTYRALSDPAGPLEYPPGGHPREMFFFVTFGPPVPPPRLGRRILPWHLAGCAGPEDQELWSALERFADALEPDAEHPDGREELGWVRLVERGEGTLDVACGVGGETLCSFALEPAPAGSGGIWRLPRGSTLVDGALVVHGAYRVSPLECSPGAERVAAGTFAFRRAVDGSLLMLESPSWAPAGGEVVFRKWWRWRTIR